MVDVVFVSSDDGDSVPVGASGLAFAAGVIWSLGALTVRAADHTDAFQYLFWRSVGVVVVMEILALLRRRRLGLIAAFTSGWATIGASLALFTASLAFVYALKTTTAANTAFLASVTPLVAAVLARFFLRERLTGITVAAIGLAMVGLSIMVFSDLDIGTMSGNLAAVMAAFGFASYTVFVRAGPNTDWSPVLPGYAILMIVVTAAVTLGGGETLVVPAKDVGLALIHGGLLIVVGTLTFNLASRWISAVAMTVMAQSETVFVPVWVFLAFGERPSVSAMVGAAIILTAVVGKAILDARPGEVHTHREVPGALTVGFARDVPPESLDL